MVTAGELLDRVGAPADVERRNARAPNSFRPVSLAVGHTGIALAHAALATAGRDAGRERLRSFFDAALQATEREGTASLFSGTGGVAYLAGVLSAPGNPLRAAIARRYEPFVAAMCDDVERRASGAPYELVMGLGGAYVAAHALGMEEALRSLDETIQRLVDERRGLYGWFAEPDHVNLGMAHGVPGLLAALAIAARPRTREVAAHLVALIERNAESDEYGIAWSFGSLRDGRRRRLAWCYGTPGVAAALASAGAAFGWPRATALGVAGAEAVMRTPLTRWRIGEDGLCHGRAGVALALETVGRLAERDELVRGADALLDATVRAFDPGSALGYRAERPTGTVDDDTLLTGTPGIAFALLSREPGFDRRMLWWLGLR
jgi:lantibiotic biosynthesis protein